MKNWVLALLGAVVLLSGCATSSMKGTPFYTGEYEVREGPSADRVNLWPILYYRDPALSVLWPLMEFSPDHLAVRPIYSIHDRESDNPVYNVLWPIGRFDTASKDYRFFPVYWGDDYFNVFPLYWHNGDPLSGTGYDSLFPFWIWNRSSAGSALHVMWPLYKKENYSYRHGWRLWPLYGTKEYSSGRRERFYAWPLGGSRSSDSASSNYIFPLYGYDKTPERTQFISLPYSRSLAAKPLEKSWDLALPLWYRGWEGDTFSWSAIPALSWGVKSEGQYDNKYAAGLVRSATTEDSRAHHVLPLYLHKKNSEHTRFISLPYSRSLAAKPLEKSWDLALPLWYRGWEGDTFSWSAIPALSWGVKSEGQYDNKYAAGLVRSAAAEDSRAHHVLPFYYHSRSNNVAAFYSLPWWSATKEDGSGWSASFPFYYGSHSELGSMMLTPFYAQKRNPDGSSAWKCFIPFVYFDQSKDAHFMTPLGGAWQMGDEHRWLALPLLSGGRADVDSGKTVWAAGLAGKKWDAEGHSHHVFPLYYSAPEKDVFSSLFYSTWPEGEAQRSMVPLLLSGKKVEGDYSLTYWVLGLGLWEKKAGELRKSQVVPFYSWKRDAYFYTALWGHDHWMKYYLTPLVGSYAGENSGSWAFPLYRHKKDADGDVDGSYLLLGKYETEKNNKLRSFWPLFKYEWDRRNAWVKKDGTDASYQETNTVASESKTFSYLLLGKNTERWRYDTDQIGDADVLSGHSKRGGFFPLWKYKAKEDIQSGDLEKTSSYLGFLYDTRHERQSEKEHDYVRRRVLWRLVHHEKLNGDASTDIFPGITIDSYKNGYYKCSVLWRLFRYEKDPESGDRKLDLFFIPLRR